MTTPSRRWAMLIGWVGLELLTACPGGGSEPGAAVVPATPAAETTPAAPAKAAPEARRTDEHEIAGPEPTPPAASSCEPRVDEVVFVPTQGSVSVTIRGSGFCRGAGIATARFGELKVERIAIDSSGTFISGLLPEVPPAGAVLHVHTPPGQPVEAAYTVP